MSMREQAAVYHPDFDEGTQELDGMKLFFLKPSGVYSFANFNPVIILGGTLSYIENDTERLAEVVRREREIFNAFENGSVICATFSIDDLLFRVLTRIGIQWRRLRQPTVDFQTRRSEFLPFSKTFGSAKDCFIGHFDDIIYEVANDDIICEVAKGAVVGFAQKVGKGLFIWLPCHILTRQLEDSDFLDGFLNALLDALRLYGPRIQYKPPNWIDSYRLHREAIIMSEKEEIQEELKKREKSLDRYLRLKEILWFRDDELVDSVMNFLNEMGIGTKRDEIEEEDFWIMEQNEEKVIVEVKGLDRNLKRLHISQLDQHRGAREKPDDFPALLVVNSFNKARTLKEKDKDISPNEIKKAVQLNVLILRTLDLCNAFHLMERSELKSEELLEIIKGKKGWLRITESGLEVEKGSPS